MTFHFPSFALGFAAGASSVALRPHLRRIAVEMVTAGCRVADAIGVRLARSREDLDDLVAEARARARAAHTFVSDHLS